MPLVKPSVDQLRIVRVMVAGTSGLASTKGLKSNCSIRRVALNPVDAIHRFVPDTWSIVKVPVTSALLIVTCWLALKPFASQAAPSVRVIFVLGPSRV